METALLMLKEHHRRREDLLRAEVAMTLRLRAICRRLCAQHAPQREEESLEKFLKRNVRESGVLYKAVETGEEHPLLFVATELLKPFREMRAPAAAPLRAIEKEMARLVKQLPVSSWGASVRGLGVLSLAQVLGSAGDIGSYFCPAALWKRMGMAVIDGERQRKHTDVDKALQHGYNPRRRALMYVIGENLIRAKSPHYYAVFLARREKERAKDPAARPIVHMKRAKRYMEKQLLKDLWLAWREAALATQAA